MSKHEQTPGNQKHGIKPKDMPPLDATAEVPLKHSEDVNSDKNWQGVQEAFHGKKPEKKLTKLQKVAITLGGFSLVGALGAGANTLFNGDDEKAPATTEPTVGAPAKPGGAGDQQPTTDPTSEVDPTNEVESYPDHPPTVSIEQYPEPAEAAEELLKIRAEYISGNSPFYNYYSTQQEEAVFNDETMEYEVAITRSEYDEAYLTAIFGNLDRSNPVVERTISLVDRYDAVNGQLHQYTDSDSRYKLELVDVDIKSVEGTTVGYVPTYKVNTEEIPSEWRSQALDESDDKKQPVTYVTLDKQDGNWVIVDTDSEQ